MKDKATVRRLTADFNEFVRATEKHIAFLQREIDAANVSIAKRKAQFKADVAARKAVSDMLNVKVVPGTPMARYKLFGRVMKAYGFTDWHRDRIKSGLSCKPAWTRLPKDLKEFARRMADKTNKVDHGQTDFASDDVNGERYIFFIPRLKGVK